MFRSAPITIFDATAAGATLAKTLFPGSYTCTLPEVGSFDPSAIVDGSSTIGGVFAPNTGLTAVLLDFAAVGNADVTAVLEIGKLNASGAMAIPLASVSLKSITTSGTIANVNPYTGEATAGVTWRLFDAATVTNLSDFSAVAANVGGAENNQPVQLYLNTEEGVWYYFVITNISSLTRLACFATQSSIGMNRIAPAIASLTVGDVSIPDGSDVAEGATTDAATTAGSAGTLSAKLRLVTTQLNSLLTILTDVHDGTAHSLRTTAT